MDINKIMEQIILLCKKYDAKEVLLFGSRAKGTNLERSDIDIAVSGVKGFDLLQEAVENLPTLYKIDMVNLDDCTNNLLREDIAEYGQEIYKKI